SGEIKRELRLRLAKLARDGQRLTDAEEHLWAAVELTPTEAQPALLVELEALYEAGERWSDLAVVLTHHQTLVPLSQRLPLELRRSRLLIDQLKTPQAAVDACQAAFSCDADGGEVLALWAEAASASPDPSVAEELLQVLRQRAQDPASHQLLIG